MRYNKTLAGCIDIWEDSCEFPENTIAFAEHQAQDPERDKINWSDAPYIGDDAKRKTQFIDLTWCYRNTMNPIMHKIYEDFHNTVIESASQYMRRYGIRENCHNESHYQLLKYNEGDNYPLHYDGPTVLGRHISVIQYLNDDYEGGELVFPLHNVYIKPAKGTLVLFPSNYAYQHEARPVTKGTKYAIVTWLHDRPMNK